MSVYYYLLLLVAILRDRWDTECVWLHICHIRKAGFCEVESSGVIKYTHCVLVIEPGHATRSPTLNTQHGRVAG